MPTFRAEWHGLKESLDFLFRLGATAEQVVGRGVGRAAIRTQDTIRGHLQNMVYAQPSAASGYQRTYTLMRSTHAAPPSADHGADEGRASGGADLAATAPETVVEVDGGALVSEVGSWTRRGVFVHDGVNQPQPRPFVAVAVPAAEAALGEEVMSVILQEFATAPRG
jgi:hypothetical protein